MKEVKVIATIDLKNETIAYKVEGIEGGGCTNITDILSQGLDVEAEEYTEEFLHAKTIPVFTGD